MDNNDLLRRLRFALNLGNDSMIEIIALAGQRVSHAEVVGMLAGEEDEHFIPCSDEILEAFLDGLITHRRGPRDAATPTNVWIKPALTNNLILKKLRIALELRDDGMLSVLKEGGMELSKPELNALFRKEGHKNYRICGDQLLRNFLQGLTRRLREQ